MELNVADTIGGQRNTGHVSATSPSNEPAVRCTGTTLDEEQCQKKSLLGTDRCAQHTPGRTLTKSKRQRRARNGHLRKLPSGSYQLLYTHLGQRRSKTFSSFEAADDWRQITRADIVRGNWVDEYEGKRPFSEVAANWLAANPAKRPNTLATDEIVVRVHLKPLASRRINSIRQPDIQGLVNSWSQSAAPRTVKRRYGVLAAIFAHAVGADWLPKSPCRNIHLPVIEPKARTVLAQGQLDLIVEATDDRYQAMVWLGAILGLRWEEVAGLRVKSLDLSARRLTISETVIRDAKGTPMSGQPKSNASRRAMDMPDGLVAILDEHLRAFGLTQADTDALLFPAPQGGPLRYANWRRRVWLPAVAEAGCKGAGFHDLRRAGATALVLLKVDMKTTQTRLGHSDPRLTLAIYAQPSSEADRAAADLLGEYFFGGSRTERARNLGTDETQSVDVA